LLQKTLVFFGSNEIILGICSVLGICGFFMTLYVSIKTAKIGQILKYNATTEQYNKERLSFQKTFEGHSLSITNDDIRTERILKDILKNVEAYRTKFAGILSVKERLSLWLFIRLLKKPATQVDFNKVCNYLAILSGRLSKREEKKNV